MQEKRGRGNEVLDDEHLKSRMCGMLLAPRADAANTYKCFSCQHECDAGLSFCPECFQPVIRDQIAGINQTILRAQPLRAYYRGYRGFKRVSEGAIQFTKVKQACSRIIDGYAKAKTKLSEAATARANYTAGDALKAAQMR